MQQARPSPLPPQDRIGLPPLTIGDLTAEVRQFAASPHRDAALFGVTDGKAISTSVEEAIHGRLARHYAYRRGNAARGLEFPELAVDLKVTSAVKPQSSAPYESSAQRLYGLGYGLMLLVYVRADDAAQKIGVFRWSHARYLQPTETADHRVTRRVRSLLDEGCTDGELAALLFGLDCATTLSGAHELVGRVRRERPPSGLATMSSALQWRMSYGRLLNASETAAAC